jgi:hypothetical protein
MKYLEIFYLPYHSFHPNKMLTLLELPSTSLQRNQENTDIKRPFISSIIGLILGHVFGYLTLKY